MPRDRDRSPAAAGGRPLRVLRVLTRPNLGGPTRQVIALWHEFERLGVRTLLVTGVARGVESMLSPAEAGVPRLSLADVERLGTEATGWVEVPAMHRGFAPFGDRAALQTLGRLLQLQRPDVVHTHTSKAGMLGRRAAVRAGVPVVAHTFHGHVLRDYFRWPVARALRWLEARQARRTTLLFAVSASCADELAELGVAPRSRFVVVPPAVPLPPFAERHDARERLSVPRGQRRYVAIGRLVPVKRLAHFVAAIAAMPDVHGDIVGDGPEHASLQALAERLAPGRVHLRGAVRDIVRMLPAYDALVLPSVREGCPLVAVEALAAGVPVVGYDVPGVRDALLGGDAGVLVPEAAGPIGLARALATLAEDVVRHGACVAAGRASAARYEPAHVASLLLAHYRGLVGSAASGYDPAAEGASPCR
jgi:glycosyltransferase involved in cell wall biosynthesis